MARKSFRSVLALVFVVGLTWVAPRISGQVFVGTATPKQFSAQGQPSTKNGEWWSNAADLKGSRYSPLDQINAGNFNTLEVAWRFKTDILGPRPEYKLEGTPLAINGVLYATGGTRRSVVALDGKTGELLWAHSLREGKRAGVSPRQRDLGAGLLGGQRQHRRVDADYRRRGSRAGVSPGRDADVGLLRRSSPRRQPVRREPGLRRSADRSAQVALSAGASSAVELRHVVGGDSRGHHRERPRDQSRRGPWQAGVPVRVRSGDRSTGVADRRTCGAEVGR